MKGVNGSHGMTQVLWTADDEWVKHRLMPKLIDYFSSISNKYLFAR